MAADNYLPEVLETTEAERLATGGDAAEYALACTMISLREGVRA